MLISIAWIILFGMAAGWLCKKAKLPTLIGMILVGIVVGPEVLDLVDASILNISSEIRKMALIIILIRAGITLDVSDLKKVGRPAFLMCFLPACCEIIGMVLVAPMLFDISRLDAAIMGAVVAAVSPAVVVPRMVNLIVEGYGTKKGVPQLILAGASVDDVFVIVMFQAFVGLAQGESVSVRSFVNVPISIVLGIIGGIIVGKILSVYFTKFHMRDTVKVALILAIAFILCFLEDEFSDIVPFAALIAIMFIGISLKKNKEELAGRLSLKFNKMWVVAEIFLFVLVGTCVSIDSAADYGLKAALLIVSALAFRLIGVVLCTLGTPLTGKERLFCVVAYMPKATVQAAIGGIPLALGLSCGQLVLTVSVLAILITAPLGAFGIDMLYKKCLEKNET